MNKHQVAGFSDMEEEQAPPPTSDQIWAMNHGLVTKDANQSTQDDNLGKQMPSKSQVKLEVVSNLFIRSRQSIDSELRRAHIKDNLGLEDELI